MRSYLEFIATHTVRETSPISRKYSKRPRRYENIAAYRAGHHFRKSLYSGRVSSNSGSLWSCHKGHRQATKTLRRRMPGIPYADRCHISDYAFNTIDNSLFMTFTFVYPCIADLLMFPLWPRTIPECLFWNNVFELFDLSAQRIIVRLRSSMNNED